MRPIVLAIAFLVIGISTYLYSQERTEPIKKLSQYSKTRPKLCKDELINTLPYQQGSPVQMGFAEDLLGSTVYDLQTNSSSPFGRLVRFDDGTFGSVWTRGMSPTAYSDRGTGYNYFDGTSWLADPTIRLETLRTGWPSIAKRGYTGEAVVSHRNATSPLWFMYRTLKEPVTGLNQPSILRQVPAGLSGQGW
ncbi:MAG: hypothetical protein IPH45_06415 [Bacteroidales bacterium]|nr:hypothetical protein [Bacteroidales bacterium]